MSDGSVTWGAESDEQQEEARAAILGRLSEAEGFAPQLSKHGRIRREYITAPTLPPNPATLVAQMTQMLEDYGAEVLTCDTEAALPEKITEALGDLPSVVVSGDAPVSWIKALMAKHFVYLDSTLEPLSNEVLDKVAATVTPSTLGIASTGTIVLDGSAGQGRRSITLLPDTHVVVLYTDTICATVPQAVRILAKHPRRPMTWISGPSATSDIELSRVDGVHGPRNLKVILCKRTKAGNSNG